MCGPVSIVYFVIFVNFLAYILDTRLNDRNSSWSTTEALDTIKETCLPQTAGVGQIHLLNLNSHNLTPDLSQSF